MQALNINNVIKKNKGLTGKIIMLQEELNIMKKEQNHFKCSQCQDDSIRSIELLKDNHHRKDFVNMTEKSTEFPKLIKYDKLERN